MSWLFLEENTGTELMSLRGIYFGDLIAASKLKTQGSTSHTPILQNVA